MTLGRRFSAILLTVVAVVGCGGGSEQISGPDDVGAHAAASIAVVSGDNQSVGAGLAVPVAPTLRVMSERGRPLRGATLALTPEAGRGSLDAASVVTNDAGEATLPRWVAPMSSGAFAVGISAPGQGGASVSARVAATVTDVVQVVATQSIGPGGGTVTVSSGPLNGLRITVPNGALPTTSTFTISSRSAPTVPTDLTLASPAIVIDGPATLSDSLMEIRLPATAGSGGILRAFVLASDNSLIPIPTNASDSTSVTVGVRAFTAPAAPVSQVGTASRTVTSAVSPLQLIVTRWVKPANGVYTTGFVIGRDNAEFVNYGSYWEGGGGYCAGSTVFSGGWFTRGAANLTMRAQFPPLLTKAETGNWALANQLNPAIRVAAALANRYAYGVNTVGWWKVRFGQSDATVWDNVLAQIALAHEPVYLRVRDIGNTTGHAVLAYKIDLNQERIYVSDPNYPENQDRYLQYHSNAQYIEPFSSAQNVQKGATIYANFQDATYLFREEAGFIGTTINKYLVDGYRAEFPPISGRIKLKSNQVISANENTTALAVQSRDRDVRFVGQDMGSGKIDWVQTGEDGLYSGSLVINSNADTARIQLASGLNKIGLVIWRALPGGVISWADTKSLVVNRADPAIKFLVQPANANVNQSLGPVRIALVDEDNEIVPEQRNIDLALAGGTAGATLAGGSNVRTGADGTVTLNGLSVDRAGTGYTLVASSNRIAAVSSAAFDVNEAGAFSGRVFDAVTTNGLGGVTIVVRAADGSQTASGTSAANGDWSATGVPPGTYTIIASKTGYVSTTLASQTMTLPSTVVEPIPLVPTNTPGSISGNIRNASTNALITASVTVELRAGVNVTTGATTATLVTATGTFTFANVPAGAYTILARATGYADGSRTGIAVGAGSTVSQQDVLLSATGGAARIVLSWGTTPADLDSHLTGPVAGSASRFWVYYNTRGSCVASPFACLDVDAQLGRGPETITLGQIVSGVYRYYVYDFTNRFSTTTTALGASGARVQFYVGSTLRQTFFVPGGVGNAWAVFTWDGTNLTVLNNLSTISGVPQPALMATPVTPEDEFRQLISRLPGKPPPP